MADLAKIAAAPIEIAQVKKDPTLPRRPESENQDAQQVERARIKQWAEDMLASESKIAAAKKEITALFLSNGTKDKAETAVKSLVHAGVAAIELRNRTGGDHHIEPMLNRYIVGIGDAEEKLDKFKVGTGFTLNPFKFGQTWQGSRELGEIKTRLSVAEHALEKLKPYLLLWADRPSPEKKQPDSPPRVNGPVVA